MQTLLADLQFSLRQLRRSPGFALTTLLTLTMAIAANVVVFGVVNALLLHPLPVAHPEEVFQIEKVREGGGLVLSYPNYRDIRDRNSSFAAVAVARLMRVGVSGGTSGAGSVAEPMWGCEVSGNYFDALGIQPRLGRFITPAEDVKVNGSSVAVLSYASWQVRFQGDPNIVGKTVEVNKHPFEVIGVAPKDFSGTERFIWPDIWVPYHDSPEIDGLGLNWMEARGNSGSWVVGRLKPGVTPAAANADLTRVAGQLAKEYPADDADMRLLVSKPGLLGNMLGGPAKGFLAGVMAMALLVLLAACANLGALFSARMSDRAKEIGIRL